MTIPSTSPAEDARRLLSKAADALDAVIQKMARMPSEQCCEITADIGVVLPDTLAEIRALLAARAPAEVPAKEKIAPVQGYTPGIPWSLHLEAYDAYRAKWGAQPALIDLEGRNCRGGFGVGELDEFVPGWRERVSEIGRLRAEVESLRAALAASPAPSAAPQTPTRYAMGVFKGAPAMFAQPDGEYIRHWDHTALLAHAAKLEGALREAEAGLEFAGADGLYETAGFVPAPLAALRTVRAALAAAPSAVVPTPLMLGKHSQLPWFVDTERNDGEYGNNGPDTRSGFNSYAILDAEGRVLFDSLNRDGSATEITEDFDEDGGSAWDARAKADAELIVQCVNAASASPGAPSAPTEPDRETFVQRVLAEQKARADRVAALPAGTCPECEGVGYFGGEASQRVVDCDTCNGTGRTAPEAPKE